MKPQDIKDLQELIEFLKKYQVAEFDLERGDIKIRLKFAQAAAAEGAPAWKAIMDAADDHSASLIVLGSRRHGGLGAAQPRSVHS